MPSIVTFSPLLPNAMNFVRFEAGLQPLHNASSIYGTSQSANGVTRFTFALKTHFRLSRGRGIGSNGGVSMTSEGNNLKFYSGLRKVSRQLLNKHGPSVLDSCYCIFEKKVDC